MLVLGRKSNESIIIGDDITITILSVDGDRVKIGINAPSDVSILRQELYDAVKRENLRAVKHRPQKGNVAVMSSIQNLLKNQKK